MAVRGVVSGGAKQCTAMSKIKLRQGFTGDDARCSNPAVTGYEVCRMHGAGCPTTRGTRGGRPATIGMYSQVLDETDLEVYKETIGDLSLVHEAALLKTRLNAYLRRLVEQSCNAAAGDSTDDGPRRGRGRPSNGELNPELVIVRIVESIVKTCQVAYDQISEKKIKITFDSEDRSTADVLTLVRETLEEELQEIKEHLCPECKQVVSDFLVGRTSTQQV